MIEQHFLNELELNLFEKIESVNEVILSKFDPESYIELLEKYPENPSYQFTSNDVLSFCDFFSKEFGADTLELFHKLVFIKLITKNQPIILKRFPEDIIYWFGKNFNRIIKTIRRNSRKKGLFLYPNDNFFKDLGVCCMRMIPLGSQKVHISGFSRNFVVKNGITQLIRGSLFYFFKASSNEPYYQMHTDSHDLDLLKEMRKSADGGSERFYLNVASLLRMNKRIKGIFGASWMNDPQLKNISPSFFYGTKLALDNGAAVFKLDTTERDFKRATHASKKRAEFYSSGKYQPTKYLLIWPRKYLLKWADTYRA